MLTILPTELWWSGLHVKGNSWFIIAIQKHAYIHSWNSHSFAHIIDEPNTWRTCWKLKEKDMNKMTEMKRDSRFLFKNKKNARLIEAISIDGYSLFWLSILFIHSIWKCVCISSLSSKLVFVCSGILFFEWIHKNTSHRIPSKFRFDLITWNDPGSRKKGTIWRRRKKYNEQLSNSCLFSLFFVQRS